MSSSPLKIIFAGTPIFSAEILKALLETSHQVIAVYTQPDRPAGRGRQLTASPVKELSQKNNLPVYQPQSLRDVKDQQILNDLNADVMVVVAYGLILPKAVLNAPRFGCINIHASLLPRWRGAAPIQRAILEGDSVTGITTMQMDVGLDTGDMLDKIECPITPEETTQTLHDKLAKLGATAILKTLEDLTQKKLKPIPQDNNLATYAHKISKEEALLDWNLSAEELSRKIRAFNPWPIAFTFLHEQALRIWEAQVLHGYAPARPGTIINVSSERVDVATGKEVLSLTKLQLPGGRVLPVRDLLNSRQNTFLIGQQLGQEHEREG